MSWSLRSVWTPPLSPTPHTGGLVWTPWPRSRGLPRKTPDTLLISTRKLGHTRQETSLPLAMSLCLCSSFGQATMPKGLADALWTITSMQPGQQRIDLTPTGGQKTAAVQRVHCPVAVRERRREGGGLGRTAEGRWSAVPGGSVEAPSSSEGTPAGRALARVWHRVPAGV